MGAAQAAPALSRFDQVIARKTKRKEGYLSGFCGDALRAQSDQPWLIADPDAAHARCNGAHTNGDGKTSLCICDCHDGISRCHVCKHDPGMEDFEPAWRRCADVDACSKRVESAAEASRNSPEMRWLHEIREEARAERAQRRAEEAARRAERDQTGADVPQDPSGAPRPLRAPQACHCGCGGMTKGGKFIPGHDMRLKTALYGAARQSGDLAAIREIAARGWSLAKIDADVDEAVRGINAQEVIEQAVSARYAN